MGLTFDGLDIPGIVEPWSPGNWDHQSQVHTQFGLTGEAVLWGGRTGRHLAIPMWIFNEYSNATALYSLLSSIDAKTGYVSSVVEASGVEATYPLCILLQLERKEGILPPNTHIGWSHKATLHFRQLVP